MVTVISGANRLSLDVAGDTVGAIRERFGTALNIPDGASAQVNGDSQDDGFELESGDELVFTKTSAEKGA